MLYRLLLILSIAKAAFLILPIPIHTSQWTKRHESHQGSSELRWKLQILKLIHASCNIVKCNHLNLLSFEFCESLSHIVFTSLMDEKMVFRENFFFMDNDGFWFFYPAKLIAMMFDEFNDTRSLVHECCHFYQIDYHQVNIIDMLFKARLLLDLTKVQHFFEEFELIDKIELWICGNSRWLNRINDRKPRKSEPKQQREKMKIMKRIDYEAWQRNEAKNPKG